MLAVVRDIAQVESGEVEFDVAIISTVLERGLLLEVELESLLLKLRGLAKERELYDDLAKSPPSSPR